MSTKEKVMTLFEDNVESRKNIIREFIMNNDNSFEDRLEVWMKTPKHLRDGYSWVFHPFEYQKKYGEIFWYDEFYIERHETVNLIDCYTQFKEEDPQKAAVFASDCMNAGIHSFVFDW